MNEISNQPSSGYSKAFQSFVEEPDDVVGLLAYALYKSTINERKSSGKSVLLSDDRNPGQREIEIHRNQAESYLRTFARTAIDAERANILSEGIKSSAEDTKIYLDKLSNKIIETVKERTGFWWPGVIVGIVAWGISIILTVIVVYSAPDWVKGLVEHVTPK